MNIILHDLDSHLDFAPLSLTRPVGSLRMGIFTNDERWRMFLPNATVSFRTESYLSDKYAEQLTLDNIWVDARVIPNRHIITAIEALKTGERLVINDRFVAYRGEKYKESGKVVNIKLENVITIEHRWELYQKNALVLAEDFELAKIGRVSKSLPTSCQLIGSEDQLFIAASAKVQGATFNTEEGPIYIGEHAEVMEGSLIRGGFALCNHGVLKMGAKVYGATTIGPYCKVGGEVNNVLFQAYSNKGHDGFLGNSVIGCWCNLGADTNTSNLKNNYGLVKTYDYIKKAFTQTDIQFMGVMMGDYAKCGINTMFNTATVVGPGAVLFGSGFPPKHIKSFAWGGFDGTDKMVLEKAFEAADNMMVRRGLALTPHEKGILEILHEEEL